MSIKVVRTGLLTTIQDGGRCGYRQYGVILNGAMDLYALRIANMLVGNDEHEGAMEITLMGPKLLFEQSCLIALTGGDLTPVIDGKDVPMWRPVWVKEGSVLEFGVPKKGCRTYLSVSGGFQLPKVMGSVSTYLRAEIGGYKGRALQYGDVIGVNSPASFGEKLIDSLQKRMGNRPFAATSWTLHPTWLPSYEPNPTIRAMKGAEFDRFTEESRQDVFTKPFQVTPQSDRMGYRLQGPALTLTEPFELLSSAVAFGTVQVPSDGNPIVLMADHQTTGGYPRIAQVASVDLPLLAQVLPGRRVSFSEVSLEEAQRLYLNREKQFQYMKRIISLTVQ
jgi:antagonist of KipI